MACRVRAGNQGRCRLLQRSSSPMHSVKLRASSQGPPRHWRGVPARLPAAAGPARQPLRGAAHPVISHTVCKCHDDHRIDLQRDISMGSYAGIALPAPASSPTRPARVLRLHAPLCLCLPALVSNSACAVTHTCAAARRGRSQESERPHQSAAQHIVVGTKSRTTGAAGTPRQRPGKQAHHKPLPPPPRVPSAGCMLCMLCHAAAVVSCPRRCGGPRVHCIHVLLLLLRRLQNLQAAGRGACQAKPGQTGRRKQEKLREG